MIKWIKYNPKNPPEPRVRYLITDGKQVDVSMFPDDDWRMVDGFGFAKELVTHYAIINMPDEKKIK